MRKNDEKFISIMVVFFVSSGIGIGLVTNTIELFEGSTIFFVVTTFLSLYNAKVRGPEFNLAEARVYERKANVCKVEVLLQNIGDRMGYLRWEKIQIKLPNVTITPSTPVTLKRRLNQNNGIIKIFVFKVTSHKDLTGGYFVAEGVHSSHKGGMIEKTWRTPLTGMLKPKAQLKQKKSNTTKQQKSH